MKCVSICTSIFLAKQLIIKSVLQTRRANLQLLFSRFFSRRNAFRNVWHARWNCDGSLAAKWHLVGDVGSYCAVGDGHSAHAWWSGSDWEADDARGWGNTIVFRSRLQLGAFQVGNCGIIIFQLHTCKCYATFLSTLILCSQITYQT